MEAKIRKGPVGLFDVYVDESVIYSNRTEGGRLPEKDEIVQRIRDFLSLHAKPERGQPKAPKPKGASEGQCGCG